MSPPALTLAPTYSHSDMHLSARTSPRLNLRRAGSSRDNGPLSSTSSRFSFNHLIATPPPSPGLPALVPRHGKPTPKHSPRKYLRVFMWLSGVLIVLYNATSRIRLDRPLDSVRWASHEGDQYEMVGESELPDFPTPLVITDKKGRAKWTVSIPPNYEFPLEPQQYAEICSQNVEVAKHVTDLHTHVHHEHTAHYSYYHVDPNFMDVAEAEAHGLLPGTKAKSTMKEDELVGEETGELLIESDVCEKSMTFVLETADAGLGNTLMMLWTAFGLAKNEGREFFIDDSRWAYGKYTDFFKPPPKPICRPPSRHEMLPCPHHARHLVVSAATASHTFGRAFNEAYEDARKMEVFRQRPIFDFARAGYETLFSLAGADAGYVTERVEELRNQTQLPPPATSSGLLVGVHVRHGDRRPLEFQYKDSYVPLDRYRDEVRSIFNETFNDPEGENTMAGMHSLTIVASDDPDVYKSEELSYADRAQKQIELASKQSIRDEQTSKNSPRKFIDENVGWEGGFFAGMFWSLGKPSSVPATAVGMQTTNLPPTEQALRLRELLARAYLMDLAVLGQSSDKIICTVSSMGCKLLAVMMGWEKSIVKGGWINIDGDFEWRGVSW